MIQFSLTNMNKSYTFGILFALINTLGLGIVGVIDKLGTSQAPSPIIFSAQNIFFAFFFTFIFALLFFKNQFVSNLKSVSFSSWKLVFTIGLLSSGLFILFRFLGLTQSTGTFATLSQIVATCFTAFFANLFLKEKLSRTFWILFLVIIVSMYFVSIGRLAFVTIKTGDLFILFGTLFLAMGNVLSKVAVRNVAPVLITLGRFFIGSVFLYVVSLVFVGYTTNVFHPSIFAIASGFLWSTMIISFNFAIKRIGVTLATSLLMIAPTITMFIESMVLHRTFTTVQVVCALIIVLSGLLIIHVNNKRS